MQPLDLNGDAYPDKVMGCWMGKNCGGTLGAPLEKAWGEEDPFDVAWYPRLEPGGIPNDDLEMQLIWLKALEEVGLGLRAADLAEYWLDHVGYTWDEYGMSKANLRLGLRPPVSGAFNNWFVDCMGCPIRSELWACIAPGAPRLAVRYAYEDGICDHAGGEGVYGELFNTALQCAAFVESDPDVLLDIARTYVPDASRVARAIDTARRAHRDGLDWRSARRCVLDATPHYCAQYAPINMGFEVIGWLWGQDFGDALCTTVNCGYDTDCTGATVGALLGILLGAGGLPAKWTGPLGDDIKTSEATGGVRHVSTGENPIPPTVGELTRRVCAVGRRAMAGVAVSADALAADGSVRDLWRRSPMVVSFPAPALSVDVDYGEQPVIVAGRARELKTVVRNRHPEAIPATCRLVVPDGWSVRPSEQRVEVAPGDGAELIWQVEAPAAHVTNSNRLMLSVNPDARPAQPAVPVVLVGARRYRVSGPYGSESDPRLEAAHEPENAAGDVCRPDGRAGQWHDTCSPDNSLPAEMLTRAGVSYAQLFLFSGDPCELWLGLPATCPTRVWFNGKLAVDCPNPRRLRPSFAGDGESYAYVRCRRGWNEVLVKLARRGGEPPARAHLVMSYGEKQFWREAVEPGWTRFPWD